jgi:selenocysteine-specific elongation factor
LMRSIIVGTAGHIDHGKSALVRALTGTDPDRLPEEKKRGITIDLGFADLDLGEVRLGFVDVPGHERFVRNMLAGAHGIDLVALVIAADEGVMPQTREHFDICRLLNIRHGLIVITKTDLVEDELIPLVRDEVQELAAGSFLENAPVLCVSSRTGSRLDELRATLQRLALQTPERSSQLIARLPVDRAFTMKGFGAVVTGTLLSGEIREGEDLELLPQRIRVRARGVQVHGQAVAQARAGQRTAVNLGGIDTNTIERGMVLAPVGRLQPVQILDVVLEVLPGAPRALRSRARVRFHIGATEVLARLRVLDGSGALEPGSSGFAQLRLESPVVGLPNERFILRSYSPSVTIAGGRILDSFAAKYRGRDFARVRERLHGLLDADPAALLAGFVSTAGDSGLRPAEVAARTGWNDEAIAKATNEAKTRALVIDAQGVLLAPENFQRLCRATVAVVAAHHSREPLARGLPRETLRERHFDHAPAEVFRAVIMELERAGKIVSDKDIVRAPEHSLELSSADAAMRDRLAEIYEQAGLAAPTLDEALERAGALASERTRARKILQLLLDSGVLIRVQGDLLLHRDRLNDLTARLFEYATQHEPERAIDVSTFKDLAGVSRKYAIPLLEYFDSQRVTMRHGDKRKIVSKK